MPSEVAQATLRSDRGQTQQLTADARAEALRLIGELFNIDTGADPDPLIDMPMIARLAGVAPATPSAWQQRTRTGKERIPFPQPADTRYHDKPQWRAVTQVIEGFLLPSGRWPRFRATRNTTPTDRLTYAQLYQQDRALHSLLRETAGTSADDGKTRTLQGWRARHTKLRKLREQEELRQPGTPLTLEQLRQVNPTLAGRVATSGTDDGRARTAAAWRRRVPAAEPAGLAG